MHILCQYGFKDIFIIKDISLQLNCPVLAENNLHSEGKLGRKWLSVQAKRFDAGIFPDLSEAIGS
jgi:hypothetical protein